MPAGSEARAVAIAGPGGRLGERLGEETRVPAIGFVQAATKTRTTAARMIE